MRATFFMALLIARRGSCKRQMDGVPPKAATAMHARMALLPSKALESGRRVCRAMLIVLAASCGAAIGCGTTMRSPDASPIAPMKVQCDRLVEDFSTSEIGKFPSGWEARDDDTKELARDVYLVEKDGTRNVLHGTWKERTVTIGRPIRDWNFEEYPILQFEWKAVKLPPGAVETEEDKNDTAAGVYAIWKLAPPMFIRGIKYSWSSSLPVGTRASKRLNHDQLVVMESGSKNVGTWQSVRVNVLRHYRELFDRDDAKRPDGIALMTDADNTSSAAEALFADFKLCRLAKTTADP